MQSCLRLKHGFRHNSGTAAIKMRASQAHPNSCTFKRVRGKALQRSGRNPASELLLEGAAGAGHGRNCSGKVPVLLGSSPLPVSPFGAAESIATLQQKFNQTSPSLPCLMRSISPLLQHTSRSSTELCCCYSHVVFRSKFIS